jgi:hypothetical protein
MSNVARISRTRMSPYCELICGTKRGSENDSISKKSSVAGTGSAEMTLECELTYATRLLPKGEEIILSSAIKLIQSRLKGYSRKDSQAGTLLPSMVYFHLSWQKSISI